MTSICQQVFSPQFFAYYQTYLSYVTFTKKITSVLQDKKLVRSHEIVEIKDFFLLVYGRIRILNRIQEASDTEHCF
jgi:hypothetical protein